MKNCHVCNQLCEDDVEFCPICGANLTEQSSETNTENDFKIEPVLLANFEDLVSAEIFKDVLAENKIPYFDSQVDAMKVVFGGGFASEEIYVDASDFDKAIELYDEFMKDQPEFSDEDFFVEEE